MSETNHEPAAEPAAVPSEYEPPPEVAAAMCRRLRADSPGLWGHYLLQALTGVKELAPTRKQRQGAPDSFGG